MNSILLAPVLYHQINDNTSMLFIKDQQLKSVIYIIFFTGSY